MLKTTLTWEKAKGRRPRDQAHPGLEQAPGQHHLELLFLHNFLHNHTSKRQAITPLSLSELARRLLLGTTLLVVGPPTGIHVGGPTAPLPGNPTLGMTGTRTNGSAEFSQPLPSWRLLLSACGAPFDWSIILFCAAV